MSPSSSTAHGSMSTNRRSWFGCCGVVEASTSVPVRRVLRFPLLSSVVGCFGAMTPPALPQYRILALTRLPSHLPVGSDTVPRRVSGWSSLAGRVLAARISECPFSRYRGTLVVASLVPYYRVSRAPKGDLYASPYGRQLERGYGKDAGLCGAVRALG